MPLLPLSNRPDLLLTVKTRGHRCVSYSTSEWRVHFSKNLTRPAVPECQTEYTETAEQLLHRKIIM